MPAQYTLDSEKRWVTTTISGRITVEDLSTHSSEIKTLFEEGTLTEEWKQLIHYQDISFTEKNPIRVVHMLAKSNPWPFSCPRAIVSDHKFIFALCRMYQQLTCPGPNGIKVVRSVAEGKAYLESFS